MTSCSSPRIFSFQDIHYYTSSSAQAQLGNLGLMSAEDGFGFQRAAFLSDCQEQGLVASVDATIHGMLPLQNAFGAGTRAKALSALLGVPVDTLNDYRVLLFSLNRLDAQRAAVSWPDTCRSMIARDADRTRLIVSVAALVPHERLAASGSQHQLTAQITARGHLLVNIHGKKTTQISISPQDIFAWRSGHFCWSQNDPSQGPILRADDPSFDACPEGYDNAPPPGSAWSNTPIEQVAPGGPSPKAEEQTVPEPAPQTQE